MIIIQKRQHMPTPHFPNKKRLAPNKIQNQHIQRNI